MAKDTLKVKVTRKQYLGTSFPTREQLVICLAALVELQGKVEQEEPLGDPDYGICFNWRHEIARHPANRGMDIDKHIAYRLTEWLAASWPKSQYPGKVTPYPMPRHYNLNRWEGLNKTLRLELIRYMRKRLRDLIRIRPFTRTP